MRGAVRFNNLIIILVRYIGMNTLVIAIKIAGVWEFESEYRFDSLDSAQRWIKESKGFARFRVWVGEEEIQP
jgi:hypothetical protein